MTTHKHTPGPWTISGLKISGNGYYLASINSHRTTEGEANAFLIAEAPNLLEVLENCESFLRTGDLTSRKGQGELCRLLGLMRAAIARATNRPD